MYWPEWKWIEDKYPEEKAVCFFLVEEDTKESVPFICTGYIEWVEEDNGALPLKERRAEILPQFFSPVAWRYVYETKN